MLKRPSQYWCKKLNFFSLSAKVGLGQGLLNSENISCFLFSPSCPSLFISFCSWGLLGFFTSDFALPLLSFALQFTIGQGGRLFCSCFGVLFLSDLGGRVFFLFCVVFYFFNFLCFGRFFWGFCFLVFCFVFVFVFWHILPFPPDTVADQI